MINGLSRSHAGPLVTSLAVAVGLILVVRVASLPAAASLFGLLCAAVSFGRGSWWARPWVAPLGHRLSSTTTVGGLLGSVWPPLAVVVLAVALLWPVSAGEWMLSSDHSVHQYKAWVMARELLPTGRLAGWSHSMFAGYPAGELYPPGAELWVALFHGASFGALSFATSYALAFTAFFAFAGLAVYRLGSHWFGPAVGFIAAVLFLLDPGSFRQGGWHYTVFFGVWPQVLGLSFALLAIVRADRVLTGRRVSDVILLALLLAAALLCHPMSLLLLGLLLPMLLLCWWLCGGGRLRDVAVPLFSGVLLGLLLALVWLLPFVARSELTTNYGVAWRPLHELAQHFLDGSLFEGTFAVVPVIGTLGILYALRDRGPAGPFMAIAAVGLIFLSSQTAIVVFDLFDLSSAFAKLQYERFLIQAKPFWFVLTGLGVVQTARLWRARRRECGAENSPGTPSVLWRRAGLVFLLSAMLFGVVRPGLASIIARYRLERPVTPANCELWEDLSRTHAWLQEQPEPDSFERLAFVDGSHSHELVVLGMLLERPIVKIGFTPAENYRFEIDRLDYPLLRRLGVRFLISRRSLAHPLIERAAEFGAVRVYRFRDPRFEPFELAHGGMARLVEFESERIVFELDETGPDSRLKLFVGYHPRWEASLDGRAVEVSKVVATPEGGQLRVMELPAEGARLELDYVALGPDRAAAAAGKAALAGLLLLSLITGVPLLRRRLFLPLAAAYDRKRSLVGAAVLVLSALGLIGAVVAAAVLSEGEGREAAGDALYRFSDNVRRAEVSYRPVTGDADPVDCDTWDGMRWLCGRDHQDWRFVGTVVLSLDDVPTRCVWAHPVNGTRLELLFPAVPLGAALAGFVGIEDRAVRGRSSRSDVTMQVLVGDERVGSVVKRDRRGVKPFSVDTTRFEGETHDVRLRVTAADESWRNFCFDLTSGDTH